MAGTVTGALAGSHVYQTRLRWPSMDAGFDPKYAAKLVGVFLVAVLGIVAFEFLLAQGSGREPPEVDELLIFVGAVGMVLVAATWFLSEVREDDEE